MVIYGNIMNITEQGLMYLIYSYTPAIIMMWYVLKGNIPESLPAESYGRVIMVKVVFAILLSILASSSAGAFRFLEGLLAILASVGGGYFIVSMVLDLVIAILLRVYEFYGAYKIVIFNILYIPFITPIATAYGILREQEKTLARARKDLPPRPDGIVIGEAVQAVRVIRKPVRLPNEPNVSPHYDIRRLPYPVKAEYGPHVMEGRDFNPHMLVAGASGSGKTTMIYHMAKELSREYPVVLVDVKGDITRALLSEGVNAHIVPIADVGIKPFTIMSRGETERGAVERLIDSISVVEEVGSRQAHFIREAYAEIEYSNTPLTYDGLLTLVMEKEKHSLSADNTPYSRLGTGAKDALVSISGKLKDLSEYLRDDGASMTTIISRMLDGGDRRSDFPVLVFNLEDINDKARAIILELILRMVASHLRHRGPLAYLRDKPLVLIVDEAYLVTRPMRRGGREGDSRSVLEDVARAGRSYGSALILATQRISDIADGIRQNCQTWVCFNTSSPEDRKILGNVAEVISNVVSDLPPGMAYIRVPNPRKLDSHRYTRDTIAMTEGYIFRIERDLLKIEKSREDGDGTSLHDYGTICYRCMLLIRNTHHCPVCGKPPQTTRPTIKKEKQTASPRKQEQPQTQNNTGDTYTIQEVEKPEWVREGSGDITPAIGLQEVDWEKVRMMAIEIDPDICEKLANLSNDDIADFIKLHERLENLSNEDEIIVERYRSLDLVKWVGKGKCTLRRSGRVLLDAYEKVVGK